MSNGAFLLLRYLPDGSLDPDFGSDGVVTTPIGDDGSAAGLILQPDGKLVACWEAAFSIPSTNEAGRFDAKSDLPTVV